MRHFIVSLIRLYQGLLSPDRGILRSKRNAVCCFYPSCSEYTKEAIVKYGVLRGGALSFLRILRCHPWQKEWMDPVR